MEPNTTRLPQKRNGEHPLITALRDRLAAGPVKKADRKLTDEKLQKVQHDRIKVAQRRAGEANIRDKAKREAYQEGLLVEALKRNLAELHRRGVDMTLGQYRASIGV